MDFMNILMCRSKIPTFIQCTSRYKLNNCWEKNTGFVIVFVQLNSCPIVCIYSDYMSRFVYTYTTIYVIKVMLLKLYNTYFNVIFIVICL